MKLLKGDCLKLLPNIEDCSVDLVFTDLPYGTTQCEWDSIIPLSDMWSELHRIIRPTGIMVFTSAQPFTSVLITSNINEFKYSWVWEKSKATNYLNAKKQPLRAHEDIVVFYDKAGGTYNPQMTIGKPYDKGKAHRPTEVYGSQVAVDVKNENGSRYPRSVVYFKTAESEGKVVHPTQKPVSLCEYFIRTYSNEKDTVLDICMGSGSTGIACRRTNREFIGMEINAEYFSIAKTRIRKSVNSNMAKFLK